MALSAFESVLVTGVAGLFLKSAPARPGQKIYGASLDLEPAINGDQL
jgi:hypothetical protein